MPTSNDEQETAPTSRPKVAANPRDLNRELVLDAFIAVFLAIVGIVIWRTDVEYRLLVGALALVAAFVLSALIVHVLVFRPLRRQARRTRELLGAMRSKPTEISQDDVHENDRLFGILLQTVRSADGRADDEQGLRDEYQRALALNRQLLDIGQLAKDLSAALPYRETVERVLLATRTFMHADLTALTLYDDEHGEFEVEAHLGGDRGATFDASGCGGNEECPLRHVLESRTPLQVNDHQCALLPPSMVTMVAIPIRNESLGNLVLFATATSYEAIPPMGDDVLVALQNHIQNALAAAYKYDAVRRQIVTDHLTRLYNRRYFTNRVSEEIERSLRTKAPLSFLMADIDNFKDFNDTYGHTTGDRVLQIVARALQAALRTSDICSRYGGEEFAVLLPATTGENAFAVAERVRHSLRQTRYTGLGLPASASITISIGIATCPNDATTSEGLIDVADEALYEAKRAGRDRVVLYGATTASAPST